MVKLILFFTIAFAISIILNFVFITILCKNCIDKEIHKLENTHL